eukprot:1558515-Rhodomonas_salina.3
MQVSKREKARENENLRGMKATSSPSSICPSTLVQKRSTKMSATIRLHGERPPYLYIRFTYACACAPPPNCEWMLCTSSTRVFVVQSECCKLV